MVLALPEDWLWRVIRLRCRRSCCRCGAVSVAAVLLHRLLLSATGCLASFASGPGGSQLADPKVCSYHVIVWLHLLSGGHHVGGDRSGSGRCSRRSVDPLPRAREACFNEAIVGTPLGLSTADRNLSRYFSESLVSGIGSFQ